MSFDAALTSAGNVRPHAIDQYSIFHLVGDMVDAFVAKAIVTRSQRDDARAFFSAFDDFAAKDV